MGAAARDLSGRRVLVTGASSGIGAATCRAIVDRGGTVAMLARRKERLENLAEELDPSATLVCCDVTNLSSLEASVNEAADLLGGLDGVVAVAGRMMAGEITSGTPERWRELFDLNLLGPLATVRYATARFPGTGRRDVVIVGSTGALTPMPGTGIYAASKRGLEAAFDSLRLELAQQGANVSLVMPGMFETEGLTLEGVIIDGKVPVTEAPMFTEGTGPAPPEALAECIAFIMCLPDGICVNELVVRPTGQLIP
jgi:NADP-dependent 3-hydroxy acid dehydrogenase YdfG